ncbi:MAG: 2-oxoglutarate dehydrogenase E1 component, partial [Gammaproteobacteria bacterium]
MAKSKYQSFIESSSIQGANAPYIEAFYEQFLDDPESVDPSWRAYFRLIQDQNAPREVAHSDVIARFQRLAREPRRVVAAEAGFDATAAEKQAGVLRLINYYRMRGHQAAKLDPLGLAPIPVVPDLDPGFHGLGPEDLDTVFNVGSLATHSDRLPLKEIIRIIRAVYTDTIGAEYMYLTETEEKRWIQKRLEPLAFQPKLTVERKLEVLCQLVATEGLERYLHKKYVGQKRFSLEGGDALIPALDEVLHGCAARDVEEIVIGMAHRGRLNVLVNILGKSPKELFAEFEGKYSAEDLKKAGDVKYHMGFSTDVEVSGKRLHLVLAFNPSHLEIVNPVVEGSVRARLDRRGDTKGNQVLPVLVHGDAAIAGQGVVQETLALAETRGYYTGGTVHIVINNQIGFTTSDPRDVRSTLYCTDVAKMVDAPVFHVNGDDPEAVVLVTQAALDFRMDFGKDVVIDMVCFRRLGHNELDEPLVTQPLMYKKIAKHPGTRKLYADRLVAEGVIAPSDPERYVTEYRAHLEGGGSLVPGMPTDYKRMYAADWRPYRGTAWTQPATTAVPEDTLRFLSERLTTVPAAFKLHPTVEKIMTARRAMGAGQQPLDWGMAENLAYAALLHDGYGVRLSGQDSGRGTFFHRHAVLHDQNRESWDEGVYVPLQNIREGQPNFVVIDSILSEEAVLDFEYGYAAAEPSELVVW